MNSMEEERLTMADLCAPLLHDPGPLTSPVAPYAWALTDAPTRLG